MEHNERGRRKPQTGHDLLDPLVSLRRNLRRQKSNRELGNTSGLGNHPDIVFCLMPLRRPPVFINPMREEQRVPPISTPNTVANTRTIGCPSFIQERAWEEENLRLPLLEHTPYFPHSTTDEARRCNPRLPLHKRLCSRVGKHKEFYLRAQLPHRCNHRESKHHIPQMVCAKDADPASVPEGFSKMFPAHRSNAKRRLLGEPPLEGDSPCLPHHSHLLCSDLQSIPHHHHIHSTAPPAYPKPHLPTIARHLPTPDPLP
jgi:hypothetical protein